MVQVGAVGFPIDDIPILHWLLAAGYRVDQGTRFGVQVLGQADRFRHGVPLPVFLEGGDFVEVVLAGFHLWRLFWDLGLFQLRHWVARPCACAPKNLWSGTLCRAVSFIMKASENKGGGGALEAFWSLALVEGWLCREPFFFFLVIVSVGVGNWCPVRPSCQLFLVTRVCILQHLPLPVYCHTVSICIESRVWSTVLLLVFPLTRLSLFALHFLFVLHPSISASLVSGAFSYFVLRVSCCRCFVRWLHRAL